MDQKEIQALFTTPFTGYLIAAYVDWLFANGHRPMAHVDTSVPGVNLPPQLMKEPRVVINLSYNAVRNLHLGPDEISGEARFGGRSAVFSFPPSSVRAIRVDDKPVYIPIADMAATATEVHEHTVRALTPEEADQPPPESPDDRVRRGIDALYRGAERISVGQAESLGNSSNVDPHIRDSLAELRTYLADNPRSSMIVDALIAEVAPELNAPPVEEEPEVEKPDNVVIDFASRRAQFLTKR